MGMGYRLVHYYRLVRRFRFCRHLLIEIEFGQKQRQPYRGIKTILYVYLTVCLHGIPVRRILPESREPDLNETFIKKVMQ